jgi:hypothetical protein
MVRQVQPHDKWPSGDRIHLASVRFNVDALAARYDLTFEDGCDDLGNYRLAAIELPDRSQVWLESHEGDPPSETLLLVDAAADPEHALVQVLQTLDLNERDLTWITPRIVQRGNTLATG